MRECQRLESQIHLMSDRKGNKGHIATHDNFVHQKYRNVDLHRYADIKKKADPVTVLRVGKCLLDDKVLEIQLIIVDGNFPCIRR